MTRQNICTFWSPDFTRFSESKAFSSRYLNRNEQLGGPGFIFLINSLSFSIGEAFMHYLQTYDQHALNNNYGDPREKKKIRFFVTYVTT